MATAKTLDPSITLSASEAFHHPLPQVRQFHRSLTVALDEKNERLRILVGGSYRQLLGTAETILLMRENVSGVEDNLAKVGKGCGRTIIGEMIGGLGRLEEERHDGSMKAQREEMGWIARMKVLDMCGVIVSGLLRRKQMNSTAGRGKSLVVAAKVHVLSRLLVKSLSDPNSGGRKGEREVVEEAREKVRKLHGRLSRAIDRALEKVGGESNDVTTPMEREDLLQALCACSLAKSLGAKEVLRHLLKVRGTAMSLAFEDDAERGAGHGILKALRLYTRTLLDVQALVPRRLAEALGVLKSKHLLEDASIQELEGLRLDVCEQWFGEEISDFTPYVRHDDLDGAQAVETLRSWAKEASKVLLAGFGNTLQRIADFKAVVGLRRKTLEVWIKDGGKARGFDPSIVLDGLREVINQRMIELLEARVAKLHLVGTEIEGTLGAWQQGVTNRKESLWDAATIDVDASHGAHSFKKSILARTNGNNDAVSKAVNGYQTWRHFIDEISGIVDELKKQRWDDDLENIEDDITLESRDALLSQEDPQLLRDHLHSSLERSFTELDAKVDSLLAAQKESTHIGDISIYIIRVLRSIRGSLPNDESLKKFGLSIIPSLHQHLSFAVSKSSVKGFTKSLSRRRVAGRALWEGTPELPVQPSPGTFKLLHALSRDMATAGSDLWSPSAVGLLKQQIQQDLAKNWAAAVENQITTLANDDSKEVANSNEASPGNNVEDSETSEPTQDDQTKELRLVRQKEWLIQALFDIYLLRCSLETASTAGNDDFRQLKERVVELAELDASSKSRLEQSVNEYWKRTSLLFGLLA
ncbi:hypothetical protein PVAG01_02551 [Phlyctema vagabunda]|uniref:Conserved oligomeric Golgi complex subunit 1 n=1 Tax=Phlyctema vagabunda TaxID=108571 RepID=A0ABR4PQZ7_9HELO